MYKDTNTYPLTMECNVPLSMFIWKLIFMFIYQITILLSLLLLSLLSYVSNVYIERTQYQIILLSLSLLSLLLSLLSLYVSNDTFCLNVTKKAVSTADVINWLIKFSFLSTLKRFLPNHNPHNLLNISLFY